MIFTYLQNAKKDEVIVEKEEFTHLFKARRQNEKKLIFAKNENDNFLYTYEVKKLEKKKAVLTLLCKKEYIKKPTKFLHIIWCIIDVKIIEKTLPKLNEMGLSSLSFTYGSRSQKNFKLDFTRMKNILKNSNMQCGRTDFMSLNFIENLEFFLKNNENIAVLDFSGKTEGFNDIQNLVVGCEGGFNNNEKKLFKNTYSFKENFTLKSENAVLASVSKIIL